MRRILQIGVMNYKERRKRGFFYLFPKLEFNRRKTDETLDSPDKNEYYIYLLWLYGGIDIKLIEETRDFPVFCK